MPSYTQRSLATLRDRRIDRERQAERALAQAIADQQRAEDKAARLESCLAEARAALETARTGRPEVERAVEAQLRRRFWARREADIRTASGALTAHRTGPLAGAVQAVEAARAACVLARQRREVVDKAIARREATHRRDAQRRAEAEIDDRGTLPRSR